MLLFEECKLDDLKAMPLLAEHDKAVKHILNSLVPGGGDLKAEMLLRAAIEGLLRSYEQDMRSRHAQELSAMREKITSIDELRTKRCTLLHQQDSQRQQAQEEKYLELQAIEASLKQRGRLQANAEQELCRKKEDLSRMKEELALREKALLERERAAKSEHARMDAQSSERKAAEEAVAAKHARLSSWEKMLESKQREVDAALRNNEEKEQDLAVHNERLSERKEQLVAQEHHAAKLKHEAEELLANASAHSAAEKAQREQAKLSFEAWQAERKKELAQREELAMDRDRAMMERERKVVQREEEVMEQGRKNRDDMARWRAMRDEQDEARVRGMMTQRVADPKDCNPEDFNIEAREATLLAKERDLQEHDRAQADRERRLNERERALENSERENSLLEQKNAELNRSQMEREERLRQWELAIQADDAEAKQRDSAGRRKRLTARKQVGGGALSTACGERSLGGRSLGGCSAGAYSDGPSPGDAADLEDLLDMDESGGSKRARSDTLEVVNGPLGLLKGVLRNTFGK